MANESTIVLGRLPERLNKYKNNDAFMCIALPDGSTGQILMRNGKAILYSKDGEIDLDAFKDKYGNYISNFVITGSLQIEGSFIAQDTAKLYFPNLKPGIMFLDENNQIKTTELFDKDFSDLDEAKDFEYNITFTNLKSPLAKVQQFVDNALTYNPGKNILSVKNIKADESIKTKKLITEEIESKKIVSNVLIVNNNAEIESLNVKKNANITETTSTNSLKVNETINSKDIVNTNNIQTKSLKVNETINSKDIVNTNNIQTKSLKVNETINSKDIVNDNFKITNSINFYKNNNIVSRITTSGNYEILQNDGYSSVFITQENLTPTNGIPFRNFNNKAAAGLFKNGIGFLVGNSNAAWMRVINKGSDTSELEIAVGDNTNEDIVFRKYNTANTTTFNLNINDIARKSEQLKLTTNIPTEEECERDSSYAASPKWVYNLLTGNSQKSVKNKVISTLKNNLFSGEPLVIRDLSFNNGCILFTNGLLIQWGESSGKSSIYFNRSFNNNNYSLITTSFGNYNYVIEKYPSHFLLHYYNYRINFFAIGEADQKG